MYLQDLDRNGEYAEMGQDGKAGGLVRAVWQEQTIRPEDFQRNGKTIPVVDCNS